MTDYTPLVRLLRALQRSVGFGYAGKTVKPKNPRRVEGGRKAAATRKARLAAKRGQGE